MLKAGAQVAIGTYSPATQCFQWEFGVVRVVPDRKTVLVDRKLTIFHLRSPLSPLGEGEGGELTHVTPDFDVASGEEPLLFAFRDDLKLFALPRDTPGYTKILFMYNPDVVYNGAYSGFEYKQ
jgi:hypothetical protein